MYVLILRNKIDHSIIQRFDIEMKEISYQFVEHLSFRQMKINDIQRFSTKIAIVNF